MPLFLFVKHSLIRSHKFVIPFFIILVLSFSCIYVEAEEIRAKAAVVIEGESGKILYGKNPHLRLPPASTTKIVTAMVVLDKIRLDRVVTISKNASNVQSVAPRLSAGERYSVRDLLYLSLMRSVNGAAVALAEAVAGDEERFVVMMNDKVNALGLKNTKFKNSTGLPGKDQYTTAYDLALLMRASLGYPEIVEIINTKIAEITNGGGRQFLIKNTNYLLWKDDEHIGGKTGYTRAAGHCLVSAEKKKDKILIAVVLGDRRRDDLWDNTFFLFSKAEEILHSNREPVIYFTNLKHKSVSLASIKNKELAKKNKKVVSKAKIKAKKKSKKTNNYI